MQAEIGRRDPVRRRRVRREAAADDVDERRECAGACVPLIGAQLGHDRHPRAAASGVVAVIEREAQITQQVLVGGIVHVYGTSGSWRSIIASTSAIARTGTVPLESTRPNS